MKIVRKPSIVRAVLTIVVVLSESTQASTVTQLEPVLVTAPLREKISESTVPVTVLEGTDLRMKMGDNIGQTLQQELGMTNQPFGPSVGRPVIRGQNGPLVCVLSNGIGSNDVSSISPDHANSTEPFALHIDLNLNLSAG